MTSPSSRRVLGTRAWQALSTIAVWLSLVNWPTPASGSLDPSWQALLGTAWTQGWQYGTDFVFTWGPWGFWLQPYTVPATAGLSVAISAVAGLAVAITVTALASRLGAVRRVIFLAGILLFGAFATDSLYSYLVVVIAIAGLIRRDGPHWQMPLALVVLAWLSLIKFTHLATSAVALGLAVAVALASSDRRRASLLIVGFAAALAGWWIAAGQDLLNLMRFLRLGLEITSGYPQAMALDEPRLTFVAGIVTMGVLALGIVLRWRGRRSLEATAATVMILVCLVIAWKHGFTRNAGHEIVFFLFVVHLAGSLPAIDGARTREWATPVACVLALGGVWLIRPDLVQVSPSALQSRVVVTARQLAQPDIWRSQFDLQQQAEAKSWAFPRTAAVVGSAPIDLVDSEQGILLLNGLNYSPRPVPQSYVAYTPALLRENRAFFESARLPEFLLVGAVPLDGRYLGQSDSLLLAEVPRRYEPVLEERGYTLLKRRAQQPAPDQALTPLLSITVQIGETVHMPDVLSHALWLQVRSRHSPRGLLRSLFYKPPLLFLTAENETERGTLRIVPEIAAAGFVVQPFLADQTDLGPFLKGQGHRRALRIRFDPAEGQAHLWGQLDVQISRMDAMPIRWSQYE